MHIDLDEEAGGDVVQQLLVSATVDSKLKALVEDFGMTNRDRYVTLLLSNITLSLCV